MQALKNAIFLAVFTPSLIFAQNSSEYSVVFGSFSWLEAKLDAEARGGHLVTITSEEENRIVGELVTSQINDRREFWMGATDSEQEGIWTWITGEQWLYDNWGGENPNNHGNEDYGAFILTPSWHIHWNDNDGSSNGSSGYILETPAPQKPIEEWIDDGLVAHYPFNGNSRDASGNGQNLSNSNVSYRMDRFGVASSASFYSGNDSHSSATLAFPVKEKTFTGWVLLDNTQQKGGGAFGIDEAPNIGEAFDSVVYNERSQGWRFGSENNVRGSDSGVFGDNTNWYHIVATYKENEFKMYMNGGIIDLTTAYKTKEFRENSTIRIGMRHLTGGGNIFLAAAIDDVRLYNRALSATEVAQLYEYESAPPAPQKPIEEWIDDGLVVYYPFDGDSKDRSGNEYHIEDGAELGNDRFGFEYSAAIISEKGMQPTEPYDAGINDLTVSLWVFREKTEGFPRIMEGSTSGLDSDNLNLNIYLGELRWIVSYPAFNQGLNGAPFKP